MKTPVLSAAPGQLIKFHGEPCLVLEHRTDGTLLLATNQVQKPFGTDNDFAKSTLMDHLNGPWLEALTENHPEEVLPRIVDLTAVNGSKQYGFCKCKAAPLTLDEVRKYHAILPKPESWEWMATPWSTPEVDDDDEWVAGLDSDGYVHNYYCNYTHGSRPAFLISSHHSVELDGIQPEELTKALAQFSIREMLDEIRRRVSTGEA